MKTPTPSLEELTARYLADRSIDNRNAIATELYPQIGLRVNRFIRKTRFDRDIPELYSHASIALLKAIERYDPDKAASMRSWCITKLDFALLELITKHKRTQKHAHVYCSPIEEDGESSLLTEATCCDESTDDAADAKGFFLLLEGEFTQREKIVFELHYRQGITLREVGERFGFTVPQIQGIWGYCVNKLRFVVATKYPQIEEYYGKNAMDFYSGRSIERDDLHENHSRDC